VSSTRWRRPLLLFAACAAIWAAAVAVTGGFAFRTAWIRLSSQNPIDPALIALTCAAIVAVLDFKAGRPLTARALTALVAALGCALVIGQWADARPLWLDEEMIALNYRDRSFASLGGRLWLEQSAPLGWLALQRSSLLALGSGELAVRLIPSAFGLATILCAAWIGLRWLTPVGSVTLVLLCSFGQWLSFYAIELKHYSADTFFGLLLPALAVAATESLSDDKRERRVLAWGAVAAIGQWISVGALLVLPACGLMLAVTSVRRCGRRAWRTLIPAGLLIIGSFAVHYLLALRHARESQFFQEFWAFAFPPAAGGAAGTLSWFADQLQPFAMKPGGTGLWLTFWIAAAIGFVAAPHRALGRVAGAIVLSGFLLTLVRVVPFYERLSLWFLPSIYLGIALFVDTAVSFAGKSRERRLVFAALSAVAGGVAFQLCGDVVRRGIDDVQATRPSDTNRYVDDRSSVRWLMAQRQPGDLIVTTRLGLPALWWYGNVDISENGGRPEMTHRLFIAEHLSGTDCDAQRLRTAVESESRALVYFGFEDYPKWFDDLVLRDLSAIGSVVALRQFGTISRAAIVDFRLAPSPGIARWSDAGHTANSSAPCSVIRPAERW
jgi:hypothetical protein